MPKETPSHLKVKIQEFGLGPKIRQEVARDIRKALGGQIDLFPNPDNLTIPRERAKEVRDAISGILSYYDLEARITDEELNIFVPHRTVDVWKETGYGAR
ncbi:hypothetical protein KKA95_03320 [Patescibacteria group bacterium]|nr:hypothetical protein [Patescibacteria group bacterium]